MASTICPHSARPVTDVPHWSSLAPQPRQVRHCMAAASHRTGGTRAPARATSRARTPDERQSSCAHARGGRLQARGPATGPVPGARPHSPPNGRQTNATKRPAHPAGGACRAATARARARRAAPRQSVCAAHCARRPGHHARRSVGPLPPRRPSGFRSRISNLNTRAHAPSCDAGQIAHAAAQHHAGPAPRRSARPARPAWPCTHSPPSSRQTLLRAYVESGRRTRTSNHTRLIQGSV